MDEFLSRKFSSLCLTNVIPDSVKLCMIQIVDSYITLLDSITECIDHVNQNGWIPVISQSKRSLINNKILLASKVSNADASISNQNNSVSYENIQKDTGDISYHVTQIIITTKELLDKNTVRGSVLNAKINVTNIENSTIAQFFFCQICKN